LDWLSFSEIVFGMAVAKKIEVMHVPAHRLSPPYDMAMKILQEGKEIVDVVDKIGTDAVMTAKQAVETVGEKLPADWMKGLEKAEEGIR
jgi:hypothetical protein